MKNWSRPSVNAASAAEVGGALPAAGMHAEPRRDAPRAQGSAEPGLLPFGHLSAEAAFAALYERHAPLVHAVLIARVPRHDAEDLMQEVFFSAWRALGQLRDGEHAGAWLAAIARHAAARARHRTGPRLSSLEPETDDEGRPGASIEPADPRARRDDSEELLAVLRSLPEAYRETLALRLVEGLSGPQIAQATGLTHGSVRVNLVRGMRLLKAALRRKGWP